MFVLNKQFMGCTEVNLFEVLLNNSNKKGKNNSKIKLVGTG